VLFPGTSLKFQFIQEVNDVHLLQAILLSSEHSKDLVHYISSTDNNLKETITKKIKYKEEEKKEYKHIIESYKQYQAVQANIISSYNNAINQTELQIEQKSQNLLILEQQTKLLKEKHNGLVEEISSLIGTELIPLTKEITEEVIKEIRNILANEAKDEALISVVNNLISLIKNEEKVDHVTVNVSDIVDLVELLDQIRWTN